MRLRKRLRFFRRSFDFVEVGLHLGNALELRVKVLGVLFQLPERGEYLIVFFAANIHSAARLLADCGFKASKSSGNGAIGRTSSTRCCLPFHQFLPCGRDRVPNVSGTLARRQPHDHQNFRVEHFRREMLTRPKMLRSTRVPSWMMPTLPAVADRVVVSHR